LRAAEEKYGKQLTILHVDQEEPTSAVQQFAAQYGLSSPFLMDPNGQIGRLYQLRGTPTTFFIDSDGVIQGFQPGFISSDSIESNFNQSS
jgi:peroxiredoxin